MTYESMVEQLEDSVDVLKHVHPTFDFLFLFGHSNGYGHLQPEGLSLTKIVMRYGGIQPRMRENLLTQDGFGPFHTENCLLQTGMKQSIQYLDTDSGPCYFSTKEELKEG